MNTRQIFAMGAAIMLVAGAFAQSGPPSPSGSGGEGTNTVDLAAIEAARQAAYTNRFKAWVTKDEPLLTVATFATTRASALGLITTNMTATNAAQYSAVTNWVATNLIGMPLSWTNAEGQLFVIDRIENGIPGIKSSYNLGVARSMEVTNLWPSGPSGFNLTGSNVVGGIWDETDIYTNHVEFSSGGLRVLDFDGQSSSLLYHATHVAGTMAAKGNNPFAIGMAYQMTLASSDFINDLAEIPATVDAQALTFSNHSYGYRRGWEPFGNIWVWSGEMLISTNKDWVFGYYNEHAQVIDSTVYQSRTFLPVWAAGNELAFPGPPTQPVDHYAYYNGVPFFFYATNNVVHGLDGGSNGHDTLTTYSTAKNALVVGASVKINGEYGGYTGTNSVQLAGFSSRGPTDDGRIKPDVVAPGVDVYSPYITAGNYAVLSGTSMAAPAVSGTLGLLTELHQRYTTNQPMLASTMKAVIINTAYETGGAPGPDYNFGFGLVNAAASASLIMSNFASTSVAHIKEVRLVSGDYVEFPVVATNTKPLRVTIAWTDPKGPVLSQSLDNTNSVLVNDLDLRLILPGVSTNMPWKLDVTNPTAAATTGDNKLDNVEQIDITAPSNGVYVVRVTHKGGLVNESGVTNDQRLSIVVSGNIPQPAINPLFSDVAMTSSNRISFLWNSEVGRIYLLQYRDDVATGVWQNASGEISATKTNTAYDVTLTGSSTNRFYRLVQTR